MVQTLLSEFVSESSPYTYSDKGGWALAGPVPVYSSNRSLADMAATR